jgi:hypothetical protein
MLDRITPLPRLFRPRLGCEIATKAVMTPASLKPDALVRGPGDSSPSVGPAGMSGLLKKRNRAGLESGPKVAGPTGESV